MGNRLRSCIVNLIFVIEIWADGYSIFDDIMSKLNIIINYALLL